MNAMHTEVLRAMPPAPAELSARQIHERVGNCGIRTIKAALAELIFSRQVIRGGDDALPTYRRVG